MWERQERLCAVYAGFHFLPKYGSVIGCIVHVVSAPCKSSRKYFNTMQYALKSILHRSLVTVPASSTTSLMAFSFVGTNKWQKSFQAKDKLMPTCVDLLLKGTLPGGRGAWRNPPLVPISLQVPTFFPRFG